jgi:hypothetical protein
LAFVNLTHSPSMLFMRPATRATGTKGRAPRRGPPARNRPLAALALLALALAPLAQAQATDGTREAERYSWLAAPDTASPVVVPGDNDRPGKLLAAAPLGQHPVPEQSRAVESAEARVRKAIASLSRAEQALRDGQEPLPHERQHLTNGHSRLKQAYFDRIDGLERAVTQARREVAGASAARDALLP